MADATLTLGFETGPALTQLDAQLSAFERRRGLKLNFDASAISKGTTSLDSLDKGLGRVQSHLIAFGASALVFGTISKAIEDMVVQSVKLDASLAKINISLNASQSQLKAFGNTLFDIAKNTGASIDETTKIAQEFASQGLSVSDTAKKTSDALKLIRISGIDANDAVEVLTNTSKVFNKESLTSSDIINKLASVQGKYAVSTKDVAVAVQKSGEAANEAGVSFNQLIAIVTNVAATTQKSGDTIAVALNTIFSNERKQTTLNTFHDLGIAAEKLPGQLLPGVDILKNIADKYDKLSDAQRAQLTQALGGSRQSAVLLAIVKDLNKEYGTTASALNTVSQATDQANQKNDALNKTLAAQANAAKVSLEQIAASAGKLTFAPILTKLFGALQDGQNLAGSTDIGKKVGEGILSGIGQALSGPGLVVGAAILGRLFGKVGAVAKDSISSLLNINGASSQNKDLQNAINNALKQQGVSYEQLLSSGKSRAAIEENILNIIKQQSAAQVGSESLSSSLASSLSNRVFATHGGDIRFKADGFLPDEVIGAIQNENSAISRNVGGASGGSPVVVPDFSIGGQRQTIVANSKEFIVPTRNLVDGYNGPDQMSIINPAMIRSMGGLPDGAKPISNFAMGDLLGEGFQSQVFDAGKFVFKKEKDRYRGQHQTQRGLQFLNALIGQDAGLQELGLKALPPVAQNQIPRPIRNLFNENSGFFQSKLSKFKNASPEEAYYIAGAIQNAITNRGSRTRKGFSSFNLGDLGTPGNVLIDEDGNPTVVDLTVGKSESYRKLRQSRFKKGRSFAGGFAPDSGFNLFDQLPLETQEQLNQVARKASDLDRIKRELGAQLGFLRQGISSPNSAATPSIQPYDLRFAKLSSVLYPPQYSSPIGPEPASKSFQASQVFDDALANLTPNLRSSFESQNAPVSSTPSSSISSPNPSVAPAPINYRSSAALRQLAKIGNGSGIDISDNPTEEELKQRILGYYKTFNLPVPDAVKSFGAASTLQNNAIQGGFNRSNINLLDAGQPISIQGDAIKTRIGNEFSRVNQLAGNPLDKIQIGKLVEDELVKNAGFYIREGQKQLATLGQRKEEIRNRAIQEAQTSQQAARQGHEADFINSANKNFSGAFSDITGKKSKQAVEDFVNTQIGLGENESTARNKAESVLGNVQRERLNRRANFGLGAAFTLPIITGGIIGGLGDSISPRTKREVTGYTNSLATAGAIASLAPTNPYVLAGAGAVALGGSALTFLQNKGANPEDLANRAQDFSSKKNQDLQAADSYLSAQNNLKEIINQGGSPSQIKLAQEAVSTQFNNIQDVNLKSKLAGQSSDNQQQILLDFQNKSNRQSFSRNFETDIANVNKTGGAFGGVFGGAKGQNGILGRYLSGRRNRFSGEQGEDLLNSTLRDLVGSGQGNQGLQDLIKKSALNTQEAEIATKAFDALTKKNQAAQEEVQNIDKSTEVLADFNRQFPLALQKVSFQNSLAAQGRFNTTQNSIDLNSGLLDNRRDFSNQSQFINASSTLQASSIQNSGAFQTEQALATLPDEISKVLSNNKENAGFGDNETSLNVLKSISSGDLTGPKALDALKTISDKITSPELKDSVDKVREDLAQKLTSIDQNTKQELEKNDINTQKLIDANNLNIAKNFGGGINSFLNPSSFSSITNNVNGGIQARLAFTQSQRPLQQASLREQFLQNSTGQNELSIAQNNLAANAGRGSFNLIGGLQSLLGNNLSVADQKLFQPNAEAGNIAQTKNNFVDFSNSAFSSLSIANSFPSRGFRVGQIQQQFNKGILDNNETEKYNAFNSLRDLGNSSSNPASRKQFEEAEKVLAPLIYQDIVQNAKSQTGQALGNQDVTTGKTSANVPNYKDLTVSAQTIALSVTNVDALAKQLGDLLHPSKGDDKNKPVSVDVNSTVAINVAGAVATDVGAITSTPKFKADLSAFLKTYLAQWKTDNIKGNAQQAPPPRSDSSSSSTPGYTFG